MNEIKNALAGGIPILYRDGYCGYSNVILHSYNVCTVPVLSTVNQRLKYRENGALETRAPAVRANGKTRE